MTSRVAVIPYGFGLGDTVNMRPLLQGIMENRPESRISVLCPPAFHSLLPDGVYALHSIRGVPLWQRPSRESFVEHMLRAIPQSIVQHALSPRVARSLASVLEHHGFDEVLNLLETLCSLDLDVRWTTGTWNVSTDHVIDAMADMLQLHGIGIPRERRRPVLADDQISMEPGRRIALNPNAGSSLKEAPAGFWAAIAHALLVAGFVPTVISGRDRALAAQVIKLAPGVELACTPDVEALTGLLTSVELLVSPDTGVLHLAAALGTPYIGLFGSTNPDFLGPYGAARDDIIVSKAPHFDVCRVCWQAQLLPRGACGMKYEPGCLAVIEPAPVLERIFAKLKVATGSSRMHASAVSVGEPHAG